MAANLYKITILVTDTATSHPICNILIELWDKEFIRNTPIKTATTDAEGIAHIQLEKSYFREIFGSRSPAFFFKLFHRKIQVHSTEDYLVWHKENGDRQFTIKIPGPAGDEIRPCTIPGLVTLWNGTPARNLVVEAFEKLLSQEEPAGQAVTNRTGEFTIQVHPAEPDRACYILRVYESTEQREIGQSGLIFGITDIDTVRITISREQYTGPPEYEHLVRDLGPELEDISVEELTPGDMEYLSHKLLVNREHITAYLSGLNLAQTCNIPAPVFYALARRNIHVDSLDTLVRQDRQSLRKALEAARDENLIPGELDIDDIIDNRVHEIAVTRALEREDSFGALLETSPHLEGNKDRQRTFINHLFRNTDTIEDFWQNLAHQPGFEEENTRQELRLALDLGTLTGNDISLVRVLQARLHNIGTELSLRCLAAWKPGDWLEVVKQAGLPPSTPDPGEEEITERARKMYQAIEARFPTDSVIHQLKNEEEEIPGAQILLDYAEQHKDFDLASLQIDADEDMDPETKTVMKSWQRVFHLSPMCGCYPAMKALKVSGLDSAFSITQQSESSFKAEFTDILGGERPALAIWNNAYHMISLILMIYTYNNSIFKGGGIIRLIRDLVGNTLPQEQKGTPSLAGLFGSLDSCMCTHCESVYSPSAYLVDLLQFLKGATKKEGRSPLAVLLLRRPDLTEIELSCENTNLVLPYIDLVLEILENAVIGQTYRLPFGLSSALDKKIPGGLENDFNRFGIPIPPEEGIVVAEEGFRWRITVNDKKYVILKDKTDLVCYKLKEQQTGAHVEELRVQPEYLDEDAYINLARAGYPFNLPFDLWYTEAMIYMKHLGFHHYQWLEQFSPGSRIPQNHARAVACSHLGIIDFEYRLITDQTRLDETELWGIKQGQIEKLRAIKTLLKQAGFRSKVPGENYKAIRQILGTRFIRKWGPFEISFKKDPCNLEEAELCYRGDEQPDWKKIFGRIHRFLRLQQKLGWTIPELDKAITAFGAGDLDDTLLVRLSNLRLLRTELKTPVIETASWWSITMDTDEDLSEERELKKAAPLYDQVFLNKAVDNPANTIFELNLTRSELLHTGELITEHTTAVAGALGITTTDLLRLVKQDGIGEVPDELNLVNLSHLYRITSFTSVLDITIKDFLSLKDILKFDPFKDTLDNANNITVDRTLNTRRFVKRVQEIKGSSFSIARLGYLLQHSFEETIDLFVPTDNDIARVLDQLRAKLLKLAADYSPVPDPEGQLTGKRLAKLLNPADAEQVAAILGGKQIYTAKLVNLPANVEFPDALPENDPLRDRVVFDETAGELQVTDVLSSADKTALLGLGQQTDQAYRNAIEEIYKKPRNDIKVLFGEYWEFTNLIHNDLFDPGEKPHDRFRMVLRKVSSYLCETLSRNLVKEQISGELQLETSTAALLLERLVKGNMKPEAMEDFLILPEISLSETEKGNRKKRSGMIRAKESGTYSFSLDPAAGNAFLSVNNRLFAAPADTVQLKAGKYYPILVEYPASAATPGLLWTRPGEKEPETVPMENLIPVALITCYRRLHKCALLITGFHMKEDELIYFTKHKDDFSGFDLNDFPITPDDKVSPFGQWQQLRQIYAFRDSYSQAGPTLIDVFSAAHRSVKEAKDHLLGMTGWNEADLNKLMESTGFDITQNDLVRGLKLDKLHNAFTLLRRLGISAGQLLMWSKPHLTADITALDDPHLAAKKTLVQSLKQVVKAKYGHKAWLEVARPLRDTLREMQLTALVSYLCHVHRFKNPEALYAHFLVDVEMSSCMMTSRIKQAISSVQLFIQRCLMNLEPDVSLSPAIAREWKWRKNYRVWEANRKVFLYPENWIEPQLRDDKSPFFRDLENELLQSELTSESAEQAFMRYLQKLDEVARLEMTGMCEDKEQDVVHVFGRTHDTPHIYFYRRWVDQTRWTPWEQVDLDIEGNHLMPVVWNRRLYLFWPVFTEKERQTGMGGNKKSLKYLEIQLAWSEYRNGMWTPKKVSEKYLKNEDSYYTAVNKSKVTETHSVTFNITDYKINNHNFLLIRLYIPWTNENRIKLHVPVGEFILTESRGTIEIKMGFTRLVKKYPIIPLDEFYITNMLFASKNTRYSFPMVCDYQPSDFDIIGQYDEFIKARINIPVINNAPTTLYLLLPHQNYNFKSHSPYFYKDNRRTFFISPITLPPDILLFKDSFVQKLRMAIMAGDLPLYKFNTFYHPYLPEFIRQLNRHDIDGLLNPDPDGEAKTLIRQQSSNSFFYNDYDPFSTVGTPYPVEEVEFHTGGAYSLYNWELFFHIPLMVACLLSKNQRFEDAAKWFHYIFDPTETPVHGLLGTYYSDKDLQQEAFSRIDTRVDFDWGAGTPDPRIKTDEFSIRWLAKLKPPFDGEYTFFAATDDGARLWVDETLLIDEWRVQSVREFSGKIRLKAGKLYTIKMEYFENRGEAVARLSWQGPGIRKQIIPQSCLYVWTPFWKIRPFADADTDNSIQRLMKILAISPAKLKNLGPELTAIKEDINKQVDEWKKHPFQPHLIARMRITAYMQNVVMKYIDNLIAWGDQLFRRDSIESINEATQLYILAHEILGERPEKIPPKKRTTWTYGDMESKEMGAFSNILTMLNEIENKLVLSGFSNVPVPGENHKQENLIMQLYFCIPENAKQMEYWDTVEDRLFKIRHCMNIEGVVRQLPLFQPPIDPALLVRAAASGIDFNSVLDNLYAPPPHYRFQVIYQKAKEYCTEVQSLGTTLLSALEKKEAEELSLLRSRQEVKLLKAIKEVKKQQLKEAEKSLAAMEHAAGLVAERKAHYEGLIAAGLNENENVQLKKLENAFSKQETSEWLNFAASIAHLLPSITYSTGMGWGMSTEFGGPHIAGELRAIAQAFSIKASKSTYKANIASINAGHERRAEEWQFQVDLAAIEEKQVKKQLTVAEIRVAIAEKELSNHEIQTENAKEVYTYMKRKFTNKQLYSWMVSQVSTLYFQSYKMAFDLVRKAEKAFQHELGLPDASFIQFGYWDSMKKGLLAGEKLHFDLKRMETAFLEKNKREYEITKHISLAMIDPRALISLKTTGECYITIPEALFDLDYPGHYMRRIKSVSLTIPCVTGPYTSVNCTLTLHGNWTRISNKPGNTYVRNPEQEDNRFTFNAGATQSIATSYSQEDSGMFELNFRDERYLPFEGAGVISTWHLELPQQFPQFDYTTISDVIMHMRYTARNGGISLKKAAENSIQAALNSMQLGRDGERKGLYMIFSARHDFSSQWHRFFRLEKEDTGNTPVYKHTLHLDFSKDHFPFPYCRKTIKLACMIVIFKVNPNIKLEELANPLEIEYCFTIKGKKFQKENPKLKYDRKSGILFSSELCKEQPLELTGEEKWLLEMRMKKNGSVNIPAVLCLQDPEGVESDRLDPDAVEDIYFIIKYQVSEKV